MCDNFENLSETYFRISVALLCAEFGFLTKLNDSTTMKGKCYGSRVYLKNAIVGIKVRFNTIVFFSVKLHTNFYLFQMLVALDVGER